MEENKLLINENNGGQLSFFPEDNTKGQDKGTVSGSQSADNQEYHGGADINRHIMMALLFAVPGPVQLSMLARACGISRQEASAVIKDLKDSLKSTGSGILIKETDLNYELYTNPAYFDNLVSVIQAPKKPELTDIMMETLAIVAGKAPTTRVEIEKIRGVKSDFAVNKLIEYGLIEEKGRLNAPGRPVLFGPTDEFYRRFGVDDDHPFPKVDKETEDEISGEAKAEAGVITDESRQPD